MINSLLPLRPSVWGSVSSWKSPTALTPIRETGGASSTIHGLCRRLTTIALPLGLAMMTVAAAGTPSFALPTNVNIGTINTQGSGNWQNTVVNMLETRDLRVLAIQESGRVADDVNFGDLVCPPNNVNLRLTHYFVDAGSDRRHPYNLYHASWDQGNARTWMTVVTRGPNGLPADRVRVYWPQNADGTMETARPAIGVYFADINTYFWNIHAKTGSQDARIFLENLPHETNLDAQANNVEGGINWVIMGDWNIEPNHLALTVQDNHGRILRTFGATHQGGRELDYMVARNGGNSHAYNDRASPHPTGSDHSQGVYTMMRVNNLTPN
jgi:hypothetical protein